MVCVVGVLLDHKVWRLSENAASRRQLRAVTATLPRAVRVYKWAPKPCLRD
jgi:hypothetical protein